MNGQDPFVPKLSQREYLDRLKTAGYRGNQALGIMVDAGFDGESVRADILSDYEAERQEFLRQQEELRRGRVKQRSREEPSLSRKERNATLFRRRKKRVYLPNLRVELYCQERKPKLIQQGLRELSN